MCIVIVNFGLGNTHSVAGALGYLGFNNVKISKDWCDLKTATHLILPGVGSFDSAMQEIRYCGIDRYIRIRICDVHSRLLSTHVRTNFVSE